MIVLAVLATAVALTSLAAWLSIPRLTLRALNRRAVRAWKAACLLSVFAPWALVLVALEWAIGAVSRWRTPAVEVGVLAVFAGVLAAYIYDSVKGVGESYWTALHNALEAATSQMNARQRQVFYADRMRLVNYERHERRTALDRILSA